MRKFIGILLAVTCALHAQPKPEEIEADRLVEGLNDFTLSFYKEVASSPGNVVVSPFNLSTTLGMAYMGARGNTALQMETALRYPTDTPEELAQAFSQLSDKLKSENLKLANSMWIDERMPVLFLFKSLIRRNFHGGVQEISFANPAAAAEEINTWVSDQTDGKINQLLQPGSLNSQTRLVLVSAIYLQAEWVNRFDETRTRTLPFFVTSQKKVSAPMMNTQRQFLYFKERGFSLLAMPYRRESTGPNLAMVVLLPDQKDGLAALESQLTSKMLETTLLKATARRVDLTLPKFRLSNRIYARRFLQKLGMTDAFSKSANFSGITGRQDLSIDAVIHQAFIDVDEEGTVAAAATGAVMGVKSAPIGPEIAFNADHPFLYLILDMETKQFLFIGRVSNPVGES